MITWNQPLGLPECPYVRRWILDFGFFTIRVHRWLASDDQRHFHDHAWWYLTLILKGGYVDQSPAGDKLMLAGDWAFRRATHRHSVKVNPGGCWTVLITGREKREWGFWVNGKFRKRNKYFFQYGHHPCEK